MSFDQKLFDELTKTAHSMPPGPEKSKLVRVLVSGRKHLEREAASPKIPDGAIVEVHGNVMLKGVPAGKLKVTHHSDGKTYQFYKPRGSRPLSRHYMSDVDMMVRDESHRDLNKIVVTKKASVRSATDIRDRLVRLAHESSPETRQRLMPLVMRVNALSKQAKGWDRLPKGWTQESVKKLWDSLTGERKHKVTACIKKMTGKVDDPGAFCASLADMMEPGWREKEGSVLPQGAKITGFDFVGDKAEFYFDSNHTVVVDMNGGGTAKNAAAIHDLDSLPYVGDIVKSVEANLGTDHAQVSFTSGREVTVHTSDNNWSAASSDELSVIQGKKKGEDKKSDSDIEPTHARKEWPELPPGVKSASQTEWVKMFDSLKSGQTVKVAIKVVMGMSDLFDGEYHEYKVGRRSRSKKYGMEMVSIDPVGYPKARGRGSQIRLTKRKENVSVAIGDMAGMLKGLKRASMKAAELAEGDKVVVTEEYKGSGGKLCPGDTGTVTGLGSGSTDDQVTLTLDDFSEAHSLTTGITAPADVLQKQACGCGGECGGACACATHHVEQFSQANPDLAETLSGISAA